MPEAEDEIDQLHDEVRQMLRAKKTDEEVIRFIHSKGHEIHYAEFVLENIRTERHDRNNFWKSFALGLVLIVSGLVLSFLTNYIARSTGGSLYLVFWGLVVAGISMLIRAFIIFRK
jgi:hypothetical protein